MQLLLRSKPKFHHRRVPVTSRELIRARQASNVRELRKRRPPSWEPGEPIEWMSEIVRRTKPHRILDIGCGGGFFLERLVGVVKHSCLIIGVDKDFLCLKVASKRVRLVEGDAHIIGADIRKLPFPNAHFDCVTCNFGLWHVERYWDALTEVDRVIKPKGYFLAAEMNHDFLVPDLPTNLNLKLAASFGLYVKSAKVISNLRSKSFSIECNKVAKSKDMVWRKIYARKI